MNPYPSKNPPASAYFNTTPSSSGRPLTLTLTLAKALAPMTTEGPDDGTIVSNHTSTAVGTLILSLVFLLGVPGNLFVIWSILHHTRKRSVTCLLILNLAVADGGLMLLTIFFVVYLAMQSWVFGNAMCKILFYLCCINMYASIFLITLMSLHRMLMVLWPQWAPRLTRKAVVTRVLVCLWALTLAISSPALIYRREREPEDMKGRHRLICDANHNTTSQLVFQYTFETTLGFVAPYSLILVSYCLILRRLRNTKFRRPMRSEHLILAIVITFGLFWLPYHVVNMIQVAAHLSPPHQKTWLDHVWKSSRAVTSALAFISSCANPVLYTLAGRGYIRKAGMGFMARLFEGTAPDSGGGTRRTRKGHSLSRQGSRDKVGLESLRDREDSTDTSTKSNSEK
ncbi:leukotriene B4 receptor 2b [Amia ocellicauda]|uniref:leukotriene B4 receptor 2b n=1 Tax=Amia ocellicauda TaxID=2972642 RepID=UPI003464D106